MNITDFTLELEDRRQLKKAESALWKHGFTGELAVRLAGDKWRLEVFSEREFTLTDIRRLPGKLVSEPPKKRKGGVAQTG